MRYLKSKWDISGNCIPYFKSGYQHKLKSFNGLLT